MNKAKIMLMSVAVLAIVGGALAFKAKKFGTTTYCYTTTSELPTQGNAGICPSLAVLSTVNPPTPVGFYTIKPSDKTCAEITTCTSIGIPNAQ